MSTFERLTPADRQRIGRKGGHARWASRPAPRPETRAASLASYQVADRKTYAERREAGLCVACGVNPAEPRLTAVEPSMSELNRLIWKTLLGAGESGMTSLDLGRLLDRPAVVVVQRLCSLEYHRWVKRIGETRVGGTRKESTKAVIWAATVAPQPRQTLCAGCIAFRAEYRTRMALRAQQERETIEALQATSTPPYRKDVVVYEHGVRHEFVSIWDGRSTLLDAIQARA